MKMLRLRHYFLNFKNRLLWSFGIWYIILAIPSGVAAMLFFIPSAVDAAEIGMPAGERGAFGGIQKYFYGDYLGAGSPSPGVWSSSAAMSREFLSDGTTSYFADITIIPGNTYYYYFKTLTTYEQKNPASRTVYISSGNPGEIIVDGVVYPTGGLIESATVWHNWADAPPAPANITSFWSSDEKFISVEWDTPHFGSDNIMDLTGGGGYEIYRSTSSFGINEMLFLSSVTALSGHIGYEDYSIKPGASYYYMVRSYDAYSHPMFSTFSFTMPESRRGYLTVVFDVDLSGVNPGNGINNVSVIGDFTSPPFYRGRIPMSFAGDGRWRVEYADTSLYQGAVINYKYLVNDEIYEPDIPLALGGPYRKVVLKSDEDNPSRMTLRDVWSVWTPTGTPSNLPPVINGFMAEVLKDNSVRLAWDSDPFSTGTLSGYILERSTGGTTAGIYQIIASSDVLRGGACYEYIDAALADGVTVFYRIAAVDINGKKSDYSDAIKVCPPFLTEGSIPSYNVISDKEVFAPGDFSCGIGDATGEIIVRWNSALADAVWGHPASYIIKYATFPVNSPYAFRRAKTAFVSKRGIAAGAQGVGATLNLGEDCPGYYFAVAAVYGMWHAVGFSTSVVSVAPVVFSAASGVSAVKNSRLFGTVQSTATSPVGALPVAGVEIPPRAFPDGKYFVVIKNMNNILNDSSAGNLSAKLREAFSTAIADDRSGYIPENTDPAISTVFAFELYDSAKKDYFSTDGENERVARRDITVSISYDGLNVSPEDLRVARLNEKGNFWRVIKDIKPVIDKNNKVIKFTTKHLSVYALFKTPSPAADLSSVAVYPNPFKPNDNNPATGDYTTGIKFVNLTRNAEIYIYNIAGELVRHNGLDVDEYGECRWDVKNDDGENVASGVYVFIVKDDNVKSGKNQFIGKLGIIR